MTKGIKHSMRPAWLTRTKHNFEYGYIETRQQHNTTALPGLKTYRNSFWGAGTGPSVR